MVFNISLPQGTALPILISSPHSGAAIPEEIAGEMHSEFAAQPPDTDWFVDQLYSFAPELGITLIQANYSRYVVDLNRSPENKILYNDGRFITGLFPTHAFSKQPIYTDARNEINNSAAQLRLDKYYHPYHQELAKQITKLKNQFQHVLLFEAHSIKQLVPAINPNPFPDLILGDADGSTADKSVSFAAKTVLENSNFSFSYNHPFKGGFITRNFGNPTNGIHALQLEMAQNVYMDEENTEYRTKKADKIQTVLKQMFISLSEALTKI